MFPRLMRLAQPDLEQILGFLATVVPLEFEELYPVEVMSGVQALIPCDAVAYQDIDLARRRFETMVGIWPDDDEGDDEATFWATGPCPITEYRTLTDDLTAVRISDVMDRRRYHETPMYREYFRPGRVEHMLDLGLPGARDRRRSFILFREQCDPDFSERDRIVLEVLRPHFAAFEARAALRRRLSDAVRLPSADGRPNPAGQLTPREREILLLVAQGKTNAQVAAELWVAPSTVKKHLENVYEKLGVNCRTAAITLVQTVH